MRDQISMLGMPSLNLTAAPLSPLPPPSSCLCLTSSSFQLFPACSVTSLLQLSSPLALPVPPRCCPWGIQMTVESVQLPLSLPLSSVGTFSTLETVVPVAPLFFPIRRRVSLISLCSTGVSRYLAYPSRFSSSRRQVLFLTPLPHLPRYFVLVRLIYVHVTL